MKGTIVLFQILFVWSVEASGIRDYSSIFVSDFFQNNKNLLILKSCWSLKTKLDFIKNRSKNGWPAKVVFWGDVKRTNFDSYHEKWVVADLTCCNFSNFLAEMDQTKLRLPTKHLILVNKTQLVIDYMHVLNKMDISPMSYIILAVFKNEKFSKLFSIYKYRLQENFIFENHGNWNKQRGVTVFNNSMDNSQLLATRRNFNQRKIRLGLVLFKDKSLVNKTKDFDNIIRAPLAEHSFTQEMPILYSLAQYINATLDISISDSHGYGKFDKTTGKLSGGGLVMELYYRKIDISGVMYFTKQRVDILDRIGPLPMQTVKLVFKKPSLSSTKNIYLMSLSKWVLFATLILTVILLITLHFALNWERKIQTKVWNDTSNGQAYTASEIMLLFWQALCQQGTKVNSTKASGRILLLMLFTLFMFLYVAFSASILVLLRSTSEIKNLEEMKQTKMQAGVFNETFLEYYLQNSKGVLRQFYDKKLKGKKYFYNATDGYMKLKEGNFAFFSAQIPFYHFLMRRMTNAEVCGVQEIPSYLEVIAQPCMQKSSGFSEILKVGLLTINERGIADRTKKREVRKPTCNNQAGSFQSVDLFDCLSVFTIFAVGVLLSFILMIIENGVAHFKTRKRLVVIMNN